MLYTYHIITVNVMLEELVNISYAHKSQTRRRGNDPLINNRKDIFNKSNKRTSVKSASKPNLQNVFNLPQNRMKSI